MNATIKFKALFLKKLLVRLVAFGIIISLAIFLGLKIDFSYGYLLSMLIIFSGILLVFYLNRYELEKLKIEETELNLFFLNKIFFKKKSIGCSKQEISVNFIDGSKIRLLNNNSLVAIIRKESIDLEQWEEIKTYFNLNK